jgi:hypothetical protein
MKRITHDEISNYIKLNIHDPFVCQKAIAYTLTPTPNDPKWEEIDYYADPNVKFTSMWKSNEGVSRVRMDYDNKAENSWLEDLKNLDL